jgi:hypothetical protein
VWCCIWGQVLSCHPVTWRGTWVGVVSSGLVGATLNHFAGLEEEALGLLDDVIGKITAN